MKIPYYGLRKSPKNYIIHKRTLDHDLIWFVVEPGCKLTLEAASKPIEPATLIWVKAGDTHAVAPVSPNAPPWMNYYFRLTDLPVGLRPAQSVVLAQRWDLRPLMDLLLQECQSPHPLHEQRIEAILLLLSTSLDKIEDAQPGKLSPLTQRKLIHYMQAHGQDPVTPSELANIAELSPNYFSRRFRETFNMPPREWIVAQRIHQASHMLMDSDLPITQVAHAFGYDSLYFFSRQFKHITGQSPRDYRKAHRPQHNYSA